MQGGFPLDSFELLVQGWGVSPGRLFLLGCALGVVVGWLLCQMLLSPAPPSLAKSQSPQRPGSAGSRLTASLGERRGDDLKKPRRNRSRNNSSTTPINLSRNNSRATSPLVQVPNFASLMPASRTEPLSVSKGSQSQSAGDLAAALYRQRYSEDTISEPSQTGSDDVAPQRQRSNSGPSSMLSAMDDVLHTGDVSSPSSVRSSMSLGSVIRMSADLASSGAASVEGSQTASQGSWPSPTPFRRAGIRLSRSQRDASWDDVSAAEANSPHLDSDIGAGVRDGYEIVYSRPSTKTRLHWEQKPKAVLIVQRLRDEDATLLVDQMAGYLSSKHSMRVLLEPKIAKKLPQYESCADCSSLEHAVDFVVVLGGDGTLLHVNSLFVRSTVPPVMTFGMGSLGFLAPFSTKSYEDQLNRVVKGGMDVDLRNRLQCVHLRADPDVVARLKDDAEPPVLGSLVKSYHHSVADYDALNEMVMDRGRSPFLTHLLLYVNGRYVTNVQADGIIIATATGSTAYSLSAGGSLVHPQLASICLTPICPHTLSFRPMVLPPSSTIRIQVPPSANHGASAAFDGRFQQDLEPGDAIEVRMSRNPFPTIASADPTAGWFESVVRNLNWNRRVQQRHKPHILVPAANSRKHNEP